MTPAAPTFRIFVSSTFTDFAVEREALQEKVFPPLRQLCLDAGSRFQAVDLRWGISDEAGHDQRTMAICQDEIARCQQVSPRPNFLVFLGDRYGWCPLPTIIPATEFEAIRARAADGDALKEWYRRDDNAVSPVYELRPREGEWRDGFRWMTVETRLRAALLGAVAELPLASERRSQYGTSATEQEIVRGALTVPDAAEHVYCFFRSINGLPDDDRAATFADLHLGRLDAEAHRRLRDLKGSLEARLPNNIFRYQEQWTGSGITHDSLETLCEEVQRRLRGVIESQIHRITRSDPLVDEVSRHRRFGADRARNFRGRGEEMARVHDYLRGGDSRPLIVSGSTGSGKSALLGHVVGQVGAIAPAAEVVARFVGAGPTSSEPTALVEGICRQVGKICGLPDPAPDLSLGQLADELRERLAQVQPERPLVLIVDALDQLAGPLAGEVGWLPRTLPSGVRLILSTRSAADLAEIIDPSLDIRLGPLQAQEAKAVLDLRLREAGRTLRPDQRAAVLHAFGMNRLPGYVRLVSEEVCRWKSYTPAVELPPTAEAIVRSDFARLAREEHHGSMLVARSLACLAAAMNGLAEDEILDLLSTAAVIADFARRSPNSPPVRRLPPVVWARLYADLAPYFDERVADTAGLITFHDPSVRGVVVTDYLAGEAGVRYHGELAEYFRAQKFSFQSRGSIHPVANFRVLRELPWHLLGSNRWEELAELLTDFHFLDSAANAGCAGEILPYLTELKPRVSLLDYFTRAIERLGSGKRDHGIEFVAPSVALFHDAAGAEAAAARRINEVVIRYLRPLFEPHVLIPFLERAVELAARTSGPLAQALRNNLGTLLLEAGEIDRARALFASATAGHGTWTQATALHGQGMAALQSGNLDAAEEALREALRLHGTVPGPHSSGVADDLAGLGAVAERRGRLGEAQALYHQELSAVEEGLGLTHPRTLDAHRRLAWVCRKSGALDRAEHHYRWVIRWAQVSHGTRHRQVQEDRMFLGVVLCSGGRFEEAWVVLKEIWDLDPHALDKALPPSKAEAFRGVANMLREEKRTAEARSVLWHAFESLDRDPEATDAQRVVCMEPLVGLLVEEGRVREALPLLRRALAWAVRQLGYDHEQAVARRRRVRAAEAFLREEPDALKVECVFCGVEGSPPLAELEDVDTGEYECSACGGVLHQPSLCTQREQELIPSPSEYVHRGGQWFRSRGLPFPFYIRVQCKKCGHEATHYTRRGETGPGSTCPKCGHADEAQPTPETPAAGRPYWEAWGTFRGPLSSWSITCDGCGFEDHGDFHDRPESSCPRCGYGGSGRQD